MKILLSILVVVNVALFLWGMGQLEFSSGPYAPARELNPELMQLIPPEPADNLATVKLPDETDGPRAVPDPAAPVIAPISPIDDTITATTAQCLVFGPYESATARDRTGRQLQQMNVDIKASEDPEGKLLGYRVYQGPFETDADLGRARRRLERTGVTDIFLVRDEEQQYISLGFFSNNKSAADFVRDFEARGVKAKSRTEFTTTYWITVEAQEDIERLSSAGAIPLSPGVSKTLRPCP